MHSIKNLKTLPVPTNYRTVIMMMMIIIIITRFSSPILGIMSNYVGWWSEFLRTGREVPVSIPGATIFSDKYWVLNGVTQFREEN
jgi:hypothetical protein